MTKKEQNHYEGHRSRLRKRFNDSDGQALADYEILELFLFFSIPYKDTKGIAKALIHEFKSLDNIIFAEEKKLCKVSGVGPQTALALRVCGELAVRRAKQKVEDSELLNSTDAVIEYCRLVNAYKEVENVHVLFLNAKHRLIFDEVMFSGTVNRTEIHIREIVKKALELNAVSIIMVHNHPSNNATPSDADIAETRRLHEAAKLMNITLIDHLVVTRTSFASLKNMVVIPGEGGDD
jgi:DNA repair protein RadC